MLGMERKKFSCLFDFTNVLSNVGLVDERIDIILCR